MPIELIPFRFASRPYLLCFPESATRRAGTPPGRLDRSHGDAIERLGDRESIRSPHSAMFSPS